MNATDHIGSLPLGTRIRWSGGGDQMHERIIADWPDPLKHAEGVRVVETIISEIPHVIPARRHVEMVEARTRLVIIESPYSGDVEANVRYARACVRDSLMRGEAPIASHLLYTQPGILNDDVHEERDHGIGAGLAWLRVADLSAVYTDLGISEGMKFGIAAAEDAGVPVQFRTIEAGKSE